MPLGMDPSDIVLDEDPQFSAHICCVQTARWIKMPLGMLCTVAFTRRVASRVNATYTTRADVDFCALR